jgi:hypothetical protein
MVENPVTKDIFLRSIKIVDIAYITVLYFIVGYILGFNIDLLFKKIYGTDFSKKTKFVLLLEVLLQIVCIGIISYIGRNLVQMIPFPLNGVLGFDHMKVKEVAQGAFLTIFIVMFQYTMQDKLIYIKDNYK